VLPGNLPIGTSAPLHSLVLPITQNDECMNEMADGARIFKTGQQLADLPARFWFTVTRTGFLCITM